MQQRKFNFQQTVQSGVTSMMGTAVQDKQLQLPPELERQYQVFIVYGEFAKKSIQRMRDVRAN
jgi:hypothetical protein